MALKIFCYQCSNGTDGGTSLKWCFENSSYLRALTLAWRGRSEDCSAREAAQWEVLLVMRYARAPISVRPFNLHFKDIDYKTIG